MPEIASSQDIGKIVKQMRNEQGLTQEELAGVTGAGRRFIIDLESGKETCQLGKTLNVLSMLGVELRAERKGHKHDT